jgi:hypothetical protein
MFANEKGAPVFFKGERNGTVTAFFEDGVGVDVGVDDDGPKFDGTGFAPDLTTCA